MRQQNSKEYNAKKVDAPKGYHWMKDGKSYKIMKDPKEGYKPHKGSSKSVDFPIKKAH